MDTVDRITEIKKKHWLNQKTIKKLLMRYTLTEIEQGQRLWKKFIPKKLIVYVFLFGLIIILYNLELVKRIVVFVAWEP